MIRGYAPMTIAGWLLEQIEVFGPDRHRMDQQFVSSIENQNNGLEKPARRVESQAQPPEVDPLPDVHPVSNRSPDRFGTAHMFALG